jgi:hypothetical protein
VLQPPALKTPARRPMTGTHRPRPGDPSRGGHASPASLTQAVQPPKENTRCCTTDRGSRACSSSSPRWCWHRARTPPHPRRKRAPRRPRSASTASTAGPSAPAQAAPPSARSASRRCPGSRPAGRRLRVRRAAR